MFTGIVEELGTVASLEARSAGARLIIDCHTVLADATEGSSIAVNGVCLTALALTPNSFSADLAPETLFDGKTFDPTEPEDYAASFEITATLRRRFT